MQQNKLTLFLREFHEPLLVLFGTIFYLLCLYFHQPSLAFFFIVVSIVIGSYQLFIEMAQGLLHRQYALDYIAALAILVSFFTGEYLVCAIIALMISSGRNLESYGVSQAKKSLTLLASRIPQDVVLYKNNQPGEKVNLSKVTIGQEILVRKGEVIPLDGILLSENGQTDESSLTGEPYTIDKFSGDIIRSGTVNVGEPILIQVTKVEKDSTYRKIIEMVKQAQNEKAPLVRLADQYSTYFTFITLILAVVGFFFAGGMRGVLAVLVVATPCPLILATPIALLGGVNAAAKKRIIVKKLSSLESLAHVKSVVFDKTGTLTIGKPQVTEITIHDKNYTEKQILAIASAIERNSLHPLAKAIVNYAKEKGIKPAQVTNVREIIGDGIQANIAKDNFNITKSSHAQDGIHLSVMKNGKAAATIHLADEIKESSYAIMEKLRQQSIDLHIFTGDRQSEADRIAKLLNSQVEVRAEMTPEAKKIGIEQLQKQGKTVAMLGDGINDAPALALADVGLVFSNEEQTAASEAADIVLLGGNFDLVFSTFSIARNTITIALQSIRWGIGLSILCMIIAAFGYIPPIVGAGIQEAIDVVVILNALRASRG
ncbi:MAG TPA: heavy metal translocating P-type ATPase [Patescibacteria group bacterium]|nr:heavy metal translocating P-type ATPase [Patescibacteria group bacterium]